MSTPRCSPRSADPASSLPGADVVGTRLRTAGRLHLPARGGARPAWAQNLLALGIGLGSVVVLLGLAEVAARLLDHGEPRTETRFPPEYFILDSSGITKPLPNGRYRFTCTDRASGATIYDVVYSVDACSRRVTPVTDSGSRHDHLLFFGCSFTYGEGLPDDETLPYFVVRSAPAYRPYNYAFHGHSPTEMLAKMESGSLPGEVPEKQGILIYVFMDAHVARVIGSMRVATSWGRNRPYYCLDRDGNPVHHGDFTTGRPLLSGIYRLFSHSRLLQALQIDLPPRVTARHLQLTARIIDSARKLYLQRFPAGDFYVVIYPGSRYGHRLQPLLERMGVKVLDYSGLFDRNDLRYVISPEDRHPNRLANETLAAQLVRDLHLDRE
jgi:hypothetical protein